MAFLRADSPLSVPTIVIGGPDRAANTFTSTIIENSATMQIGDVVAVTTEASGNGVVTRRYNGAGDKILGICVGFEQSNGQTPAKDGGQIPDRVTVESDNETDKQVFAKIDITPFALWSAPFVGTIHTAVNFGYGTQVECGTGANAGTLTENTATRTTSDHLGFAAFGPDPKDTTRGLVVVVEGFVRGSQTAS